MSTVNKVNVHKSLFLGHTSVRMCERIMGNLDVLGSVRSTYSDPFHFHQTTKHEVQSLIPDVVKGMWFCLTNHFFNASTGSIVVEFILGSSTGQRKPVSKFCMDVVMKGEKKVREKFESKLHESFPSFRLISLQNVQMSQNDLMSDNGELNN